MVPLRIAYILLQWPAVQGVFEAFPGGTKGHEKENRSMRPVAVVRVVVRSVRLTKA